MTTIRTISPVAAVRGSLWLAEACRDLGVDPAAICWETFSRPAHTVQVRDADDLARLGDRLGLGPVELKNGLAFRYGEWADLGIGLYTGAGR